MKRTKQLAMTGAAAALLAAAAIGGPAAAADKLSIAVPGVPPVFSTIVTYVARDAGFYSKYGLDVTIKPFNSGVAAARAVVSGAVDVSLSPTAPVSVMVSNAGVPLVALAGMEKPDWFIGSMDPAKNSCESLKGQAVGVDSPRGARWIQLQNMARACKLAPDKDIPTVNLSSNVGAAMVAGQINFGVLHLDDIAVIERESKKKLTIVSRIEQAAPGTHYLLVVATQKSVAEKRDQLVRVLAAQIDAIDFMYDPANADKVAVMAKPTGRSASDAKNALKEFLAFEFWPKGHNGLSEARLKKTIGIQVAIGKRTKGKAGISPEKGPAPLTKLVDASLWNDAMAMRKKMK